MPTTTRPYTQPSTDGRAGVRAILIEVPGRGLAALAGCVLLCGCLSPPQRAGSSDGGNGSSDAASSGDAGASGCEEATALDDAVEGAAAVAVDAHTIDLIGGTTGAPGQLGPSESVSIYDVQTRTWSDGPPLPVAISGPNVAVVEGTIYVLGGIDRNGPVGDAWSLAPAASQWQDLPAVPTPRGLAAVAAVDGKIYLIGGTVSNADAPAPVRNVDIYDVKAGTWSQGPDYPVDIVGASGQVLGGTLWVFGGVTGTGPTAAGWHLSGVADTWTSSVSMPQARAIMVSGLADTTMVLAGGLNGSQVSDEILVFDPLASTSGDAWSTSTTRLCAPRAAAAGVLINGALHVLGGSGEAPALSPLDSHFVVDVGP